MPGTEQDGLATHGWITQDLGRPRVCTGCLESSLIVRPQLSAPVSSTPSTESSPSPPPRLSFRLLCTFNLRFLGFIFFFPSLQLLVSATEQSAFD